MGKLTALIEYLTVILEYIDLLIYIGKARPGSTLGCAPETRHSTNPQDFRSDHTHLLELSKQYSMIESYYSFIFTFTHETNLLKVVTKINLQSSACGLLFIT